MICKFDQLNHCGPRRDLGVLSVCAGILSLLALQPLAAQELQSEGQGAPTSSAPIQTEVVNSLTQTAVQLGALTCAAKIQQVTSFLGVTPETRASFRRPLSPPDRNSLSLVMTIATDGTTGVAFADFYPVQGGCKAGYSLTVNLPQSCADVRTNGFDALTEENQLADNIKLLIGPNTLRVTLTEAGEGCNVTKTETLD